MNLVRNNKLSSASNGQMSYNALPLAVEKAGSWAGGPNLATSTALAQLSKDFQAATDQYSAIILYLRASKAVLAKHECQLLQEFADIANDLCDRLSSRIARRFRTHRQLHTRTLRSKPT